MALVVILPAVKCKVPLTVASTLPLSAIPDELLNVRLLKVVAELPLMPCPLLPLKVTVLPAAVNVPLLEKFPLIICAIDPVTKVVPLPRVKLPVVVIACKAVAVAVPVIEKSALMVNATFGIVLVPLPLRIRLEYVAGVPLGTKMVCAVPLYSMVLTLEVAFKVPLPLRLPAIRITFPVAGVSVAPELMVRLLKSVLPAIVAAAFVNIIVLLLPAFRPPLLIQALLAPSMVSVGAVPTSAFNSPPDCMFMVLIVLTASGNNG